MHCMPCCRGVHQVMDTNAAARLRPGAQSPAEDCPKRGSHDDDFDLWGISRYGCGVRAETAALHRRCVDREETEIVQTRGGCPAEVSQLLHCIARDDGAASRMRRSHKRPHHSRIRSCARIRPAKQLPPGRAVRVNGTPYEEEGGRPRRARVQHERDSPFALSDDGRRTNGSDLDLPRGNERSRRSAEPARSTETMSAPDERTRQREAGCSGSSASHVPPAKSTSPRRPAGVNRRKGTRGTSDAFARARSIGSGPRFFAGSSSRFPGRASACLTLINRTWH